MKISKVKAPVLNEKQLEIHRSEPKQVINEKQLESYRATGQNVIIQKLLEDLRTGDATQVTERQLDTQKPIFNSKYRNKDAYSGNMNKLEEKRLKNNPVEKEKYEAASSTPKKLRWWETAKSPDGLKLANTDVKKVTAQSKDELSFDKPRWDIVPEMSEEVIEKDSDAFPVDSEEDFDVTDVSKVPEMQIQKEKLLPNPEKPHLSGLYMVLGFNPEDFNNDEEIKQVAMDKVISGKPGLSGYISTDDFDVQNDTVRLRLVGAFLDPIINSPVDEPVTEESIEETVEPVESVAQVEEVEAEEAVEEPIPTEELNDQEDFDVIDNADINTVPMNELEYNETNIDGTPMAIGEISVDIEVTNNTRQIARDAIDLIKKNHPNLQIEENSLDMSDLDQGIVRYMVGLPDETIASSNSMRKEASKKN